MSKFTHEQLAEALGPDYKLKVDKIINDHVHILTSEGYYVAFIDLDSGTIEASLYAQWWQAESDDLSDDFPTEKDCTEARQMILDELQSDWELSGFIVHVDGYVSTYTTSDKPGREFFKYAVEATYDARSLKGAVALIGMIRRAETTTFV